MLTYVLAGLALSMDAFAVSVSSGMCIPGLTLAYAVRTAFAFGLFQFLMPLAGFAAGTAFASAIGSWDHWLAFGLLALVGGKMILESFGVKDAASCSDEERGKLNVLDLRVLLVLSVATSIDALAVGISYSIIRAPIWIASAIIGAITFALCLVGCEFGRRIGSRLERWAEAAGGATLVGIGLKILLEHLLAR
ncbi:MAG: manganese efflux pump MntP family protein [Spirochaetes bacterium]|nr:manganese efflux pump MntP family protein [Spirochaetota bacterium]MBU1081787.1 manganese efflux pump MntP family protein [Spirochaetota bacterium]